MEDNLPMDQGWGHDFRMIQVRYTYCALCIIITSAPPQIIRHEIPEVEDPCFSGLLICTESLARLLLPSAGENA